MEGRIRVKCIQAVCDIEVVADVSVGVVGVAIPWRSIYIGLVQLTTILTTEIGDGDSSRVTGVDLGEGG